MILDPSPDRALGELITGSGLRGSCLGPEGKEAEGVSKEQKRMAAIFLCIMGIVGTLMALKR